VFVNVHSQNFINNGTFEYGGPGLGFWIDGAGYNLLSPPYSGSTSAGNYAFTTNPQLLNTQFFLSCGDHTTGFGKMMIVDGTTTGGQQRFWKAGNNGGGVCNLVVGQQYSFSYWIRTVSNSVSGNSELADIGVAFNNASNVILSFGTTLAPIPNFGWQQVKYTFTATNACVNIEMFNNSANSIGNDFAIDDLRLVKAFVPLDFTYSVTQSNCNTPNSGLIVIYPNGGVEPYTFRIIGNQSGIITNSTGIFENIASDTYTIGLMDATGSVDSLQNIVINSISTITTNPVDTSICPGETVQVSVSGGNGLYQWTSNNPFELGFPNSNDTLTVSPTITTIYSVSSNVNNANLIFNGDFQQGNIGFANVYTYYSPNNPTGAQQAYGVLTNPSVWYPTFTNCLDHSLGDGTGKMLVVDGSTYNVGNDPFWCQLVEVEPNKDYLFSYWGTGLTSTNLAQINIKINGVSLGTASVPIQNCTWGQVTYVWNSGSNTTAEICMYDAVYEGIGNDFAIDDISLVSQNSCTENVTITMSTQNPNYDVSFAPNGCINDLVISPVFGPNYVSGGIYNATPSGLNINPITGDVVMQNSIPGDYQITYTAQICGATIPDSFAFSLHSIPEFISLTGGDYNCSLQEFNPVQLTINGSPSYSVFYTINDSVQFLNSSLSTINLGNSTGVYVIDSISDIYCESIVTASISVLAENAPIIPQIMGDSLICINSIINPLEVTNVNEGIRWYSNSSLTGYLGNNLSILPNNQSSATYFATHTVNGCEGTADSFYVSVIPCNLIIPTAFTPNNDGDNDIWSIYGLDSQYPENIVRVYNRWGELLYESLPGTYTSKPWDGKYKEALLPVGSYYYVIQLSNQPEDEPLNGIVSIILKKQ
jgi:gliding motility-associated-like protein